MDSQVKKMWVEALRSRKYVQGHGMLRDAKNRFCCLGVLCDLLDPQGWDGGTPSQVWNHHGSVGLPGKDVMRKAGFLLDAADPFRMPQVRIENTFTSLDSHNDGGIQFTHEQDIVRRTFAEIADAIEEQL
jgi:hypothetical protein